MARTKRGSGASWKMNRVRDVNRLAAHAVRDHPEFKAAATKVYGEILAEAAKHYRSGELEGSIRLRQGKLDYSIETTGVSYSWHAEFGHYAGPASAGKAREWVEGIGVFRNVVARNGGY